MVQQMYKDKLEEATYFGIKKDGMSRQKQKILTATITTNDGTYRPLGYTEVARETEKQIMETEKNKLETIRK